MQIKRFLVFVCATFFLGGAIASAQNIEEPENGTPQENQFRPIPISPEKSARTSVSSMDSLLNLSEKQQTKLYDQFLKWAREDSQIRMPNGGGPGGFGGGMPPRGGMGGMGGMGMPPQGGRPPEGFGQGQLPSNVTKEDIESQIKQMEKKNQKREKKIKKILTEEQYNLWQAEGRPGFPEVKIRRPNPMEGNPDLEELIRNAMTE